MRKLIAEWIEAPLHAQISSKPLEYKRCRFITIDGKSPLDDEASAEKPAPQVDISFIM